MLGIGGIALAGLGITGCSGSGDSADDSTEAAASTEATTASTETSTTSYEDNITVEITSCGTTPISVVEGFASGVLSTAEDTVYEVAGTLTNNNQDQGFDYVDVGVTASVPTTNKYGDSTGTDGKDCALRVYNVDAGATVDFDTYLCANVSGSEDYPAATAALLDSGGWEPCPTTISEVDLSGKCVATEVGGAPLSDMFMSLSDCSYTISVEGTSGLSKVTATITNGTDHRCDSLLILLGAFDSNGHPLVGIGGGWLSGFLEADYLEPGETVTATSKNETSFFLGAIESNCMVKPLWACYTPES